MEKQTAAGLISICLFGFCQSSLAAQLGPKNSQGSITLKKDIQIRDSLWEIKKTAIPSAIKKQIEVGKAKEVQKVFCNLISKPSPAQKGPKYSIENFDLEAGRQLDLIPVDASNENPEEWAFSDKQAKNRFVLACGYEDKKGWPSIINGDVSIIKNIAGDYFAIDDIKEIPIKVLGAPAAGSDSDSRNKMALHSTFGASGVKKELDLSNPGAEDSVALAERAASQFKEGQKKEAGKTSYGAGMGLSGMRTATVNPGGLDEEYEGTIDRDALRRVIRSNLNQIKSCYERQLRTNSSLEGKIVIEFEIVENGNVRSSKSKSSTMKDVTVESCVAQRIRGYRFPEPPSGQIVLVRYPFAFANQK